MKRDLDLIRLILFQIEEADTDARPLRIEVEDYTRDQVSYHVGLLAEAGLIEALDFFGDGKHDWRPKRLTWDGHEFLDAARDDTIWRKAMAKISAIGSAAFPTVLSVLVKLAESQFL